MKERLEAYSHGVLQQAKRLIDSGVTSEDIEKHLKIRFKRFQNEIKRIKRVSQDLRKTHFQNVEWGRRQP